jgi:hypothetical protein
VGWIRKIEREALRTQALASKSASGIQRQELRAQLQAKHNLIEWLFSSESTSKELMQYIEHLDVSVPHCVPTLFATASSDLIAHFLCAHATHEHRSIMCNVATALEEFRMDRRSASTTLWRRCIGVQHLFDQVDNAVAATQHVANHVDNTMQAAFLAPFLSEEEGNARSTRFADVAHGLVRTHLRLHVSRASAIDELLSYLRFITNCESVVLVPAPCDYRDALYNLVPRRICVDDTSFAAVAQGLKNIRAKTDWACQNNSPEAVCWATGERVNVPCVYLDARFAKVGDRDWISQTCVPIVVGLPTAPNSATPTDSSAATGGRSADQSSTDCVEASVHAAQEGSSQVEASFSRASSLKRLSLSRPRRLSLPKAAFSKKSGVGETVVGVIKLINKVSFSGKSTGIPFRASDIEAAEAQAIELRKLCRGFFELLMEKRLAPDDAARVIQAAQRGRWMRVKGGVSPQQTVEPVERMESLRSRPPRPLCCMATNALHRKGSPSRSRTAAPPAAAAPSQHHTACSHVSSSVGDNGSCEADHDTSVCLSSVADSVSVGMPWSLSPHATHPSYPCDEDLHRGMTAPSQHSRRRRKSSHAASMSGVSSVPVGMPSASSPPLPSYVCHELHDERTPPSQQTRRRKKMSVSAQEQHETSGTLADLAVEWACLTSTRVLSVPSLSDEVGTPGSALQISCGTLSAAEGRPTPTSVERAEVLQVKVLQEAVSSCSGEVVALDFGGDDNSQGLRV